MFQKVQAMYEGFVLLVDMVCWLAIIIVIFLKRMFCGPHFCTTSHFKVIAQIITNAYNTGKY